jgi:hypothetical protein
MKIIGCIILIFILSGCAFMEALQDTAEPIPVCDKDSVGSVWPGRNKMCIKFSDESYRWVDYLK